MTFETELRAALERATPGPWSLTISNMTLVTAMEDGWPSGLAEMTGRHELAADNGTLIVFLRNRALGIAELVEAAREAVWQAEAFSPERDKICIICPSKAVDENEEIEHQPGCAIAKIGAALAHLDTPTGGEA